MPTPATFRLATYATLAAACAALGYAESALLPEATILMGVVVAALAVFYVAEDRVALLSIPAANRVGGVIGGAAVLWVVYQHARPAGGPVEALPWPAGLLPYVGPVLAVLMPAKLLREEKHAGDYWYLQAAALMAVALGCALADDTAFFLLVSLYAVCLAWGLGLFYLMRAGGGVEAVPERRTKTPVAPPRLHDEDHTPPAVAARRAFGRAAGWVLLAAAVAVPAFFLVPRSAGSPWDLGRPRFEVGYAADQMLDLTRTGTLRVNRDAAFEVDAEPADGPGPAPPLGDEPRWRGATYTDYAAGGWKRGEARLPLVRKAAFKLAAPGEPWEPPEFGPRALKLTFAVPTRLRAFLLADPVFWLPGEPSPVATLSADGPVPWPPAADGLFHLVTPLDPGPVHRYVQAVRGGGPQDLGPPLEFDPVRGETAEAVRPLLGGVPPGVRAWADRLVARLVDEYKLPREVKSDPDPVTLLPRPAYHERLARELARHFARSGEFQYSLKLRRQDAGLDPVEDFLRKVRAGHCERYASALVLVLRSQGVPAQLVLGFKGADAEGGGKYVVRQEHAHAWVEALVPQKASGPSPPGNNRVWHWLSLDPTPAAAEGIDGVVNRSWWDNALAGGKNLFAEYVAGYDAEARGRTIARLTAGLARGWWAAALLVVALAAVRVRRAVKHGRSTPALATVPICGEWFGRLVELLRHAGHRPTPGQTPAEFAAAAGDGLRANAATAPLAEVPRLWVAAYYDDRFGGRPITAARRDDLESLFARLRAALTPGG